MFEIWGAKLAYGQLKALVTSKEKMQTIRGIDGGIGVVFIVSKRMPLMGLPNPAFRPKLRVASLAASLLHQLLRRAQRAGWNRELFARPF